MISSLSLKQQELLLNTRVQPNGRPDTSALSPKQTNTLFNYTHGAYQYFDMLPSEDKLSLLFSSSNDKEKQHVLSSAKSPDEAVDLLITMKQNKGQDIGDIVMDDLADEIRSSDLYQEVKAQTQGLTSRQLFQMSVDPQYDANVQLALKVRAEAKKRSLKPFHDNFQNIINKMGNDPETDRIQKELDESTEKMNRAIYGLDESE